MDTVFRLWSQNGFLHQISKKKEIFREPIDASTVEELLSRYRKNIENCYPPYDAGKTRGAVLFAVVGGKMSEGINFADGLARCVIMVGMPYTNPSDPLLIEKQKYLRERIQSSRDFAAEYYEDLCMKAVNQSIGRAIRHANDYAIIVLADVRYTRGNIRAKLPSWISDRIPFAPHSTTDFSTCFAAAARFFTDEEKKATQLTIEAHRREMIVKTLNGNSSKTYA